MISCYVPSSSLMVTLTVSVDVKMSGLAIDAMTVKVSSSSTAVSPSIVTGWHIELPTGVAGGMVRVWLDSGWKSLESEGNREINIYKVKLRKTTSTHHCLGYYKVATAIYRHVRSRQCINVIVLSQVFVLHIFILRATKSWWERSGNEDIIMNHHCSRSSKVAIIQLPNNTLACMRRWKDTQ